jgi:hypothetical protein
MSPCQPNQRGIPRHSPLLRDTQRPKWVSSLLHDENCRLLLNAG